MADGDGDDERRTTGCCRMRNTKVASKRARARLAGILASVLEGAFPSAQDAPLTTYDSYVARNGNDADCDMPECGGIAAGRADRAARPPSV